MGKSDNGKANLHMYCLQGNLRPFFLKPFLIFCHWEKKKQQKNLKKTKKAKKKEPRKLVQINESLCLLLCLGKFNTE